MVDFDEMLNSFKRVFEWINNNELMDKEWRGVNSKCTWTNKPKSVDELDFENGDLKVSLPTPTIPFHPSSTQNISINMFWIFYLV
jgi:hypothetical protein